MLSPAILIAIAGFVGYFLLDNMSQETSEASSDYLRKNLAC